MSFQNVFGGQSVRPSQVQYEMIVLQADVTLVWPLESTEGQEYVAGLIDVYPAVASLSIFMPDATQSALGTVSTIENIGLDDFTLKDTSGNVLGTIATGTAWVVNLIDNTDLNGQWRLVQLGATTSAADAAALAGPGLQAILTKLQTLILTRYTSTDGNLVAGDRAYGIVWQGTAPGTLQLDTITNLTVGWWAFITNQGTDPLTVMTSGSDTINGVAQIVVPVSVGPEFYSTLIVASASGFNTFLAAPSPIPITGGGTGATNAGDALINLGGTSVGISIFEAPSVAAVLAILGITPTALTEQTITTDTNVGPNSGLAFVATNALTLNLAQTGTLTNTFFFAAYAEGGDVTIAPNAADSINGAAVGASLTLAQGASVLMITDAAGNWWPLFLSTPGVGTGWVVNSGASYTVAGGIGNVVVNKSAGSATLITLPSSPSAWREITVIDGKGDAPTNPITIGGTVNGIVNPVMMFAFQSLTVVYAPTVGWRTK